MPAPAPRPYLIEEYTQTVCPLCFADAPRRADDPGVWCDGMLVSHDGKVWMRRFCAQHGETESLYEEDLALWRVRAGWSTPTSPITPDRPDNYGSFPLSYQHGLPAAHGQHSCILVLNVTPRCNLSCPTCYAGAAPPGTPRPTQEHPTPDQLEATVETIIEREGGELGVLMLSGGEPTIRDDLQTLVERALRHPVTRVLINTNGRRIARDDRFLEFLHAHRDRIEIYLQFDGLSERSNLRHRGEDLRAEKVRALDRLEAAGVWSTLVMTVARGVNEDEVGDVLRFGLDRPLVSGLAIQPMFGSGRNPGFDPQDRVTPTGVLRRLRGQTGGLLTASDFLPLPCSHRDCCDISYLLRTGKGAKEAWQPLPRLIGPDTLKGWLHLVANTISFEDVSQSVASLLQSGALGRIWSDSGRVPAFKLARDISQMCGCVAGLPELLGLLWDEERSLERLAQRTFRVTVKQFMDAHTLHAPRLKQCCVHTGTFEDDPRRYSFCWRFLFDDATDSGPRPPLPASESPGRASESPGRASESLGRASESPGRASESPGRASESPGRASESPGRASESPGRASESPGRASESLGRASESPGRASESPGRASESPVLVDGSPAGADEGGDS